MIIDLPSGEITYTDIEPLGGWTYEHRSEKLVLRRIKSGTFIMGSPTNELGRSEDEVQHKVTISKPFYIGIFEITQKQYQIITGNNPSEFKGDTKPVHDVSYNDIRGREKGVAWPDNDDVDDYSFLGKLRARTKMNFDLPTEAQWEYACRAGTTTALNNGTDLSSVGIDKNLDLLGFYVGNGGIDGLDEGIERWKWKGPTVVGSYRPNFWDLYDMHGNVEEWCLDKYYPKDASKNSPRVLRGGSWEGDDSYCRSAYRYYRAPDYANWSYGFRVVLVQE